MDLADFIFSIATSIFPLLIFVFIVWKVKKGLGSAAELFQKGRYVDGKFVIDDQEIPDEAQELLKDEDGNNVPDIVDQLRDGHGRGSFIHVTKKTAFPSHPRKTDALLGNNPVIEEGSNVPQLLFGLLGVVILALAWYFFG